MLFYEKHLPLILQRSIFCSHSLIAPIPNNSKIKMHTLLSLHSSCTQNALTPAIHVKAESFVWPVFPATNSPCSQNLAVAVQPMHGKLPRDALASTPAIRSALHALTLMSAFCARPWQSGAITPLSVHTALRDRHGWPRSKSASSATLNARLVLRVFLASALSARMIYWIQCRLRFAKSVQPTSILTRIPMLAAVINNRFKNTKENGVFQFFIFSLSISPII